MPATNRENWKKAISDADKRWIKNNRWAERTEYFCNIGYNEPQWNLPQETEYRTIQKPKIKIIYSWFCLRIYRSTIRAYAELRWPTKSSVQNSGQEKHKKLDSKLNDQKGVFFFSRKTCFWGALKQDSFLLDWNFHVAFFLILHTICSTPLTVCMDVYIPGSCNTFTHQQALWVAWPSAWNWLTATTHFCPHLELHNLKLCLFIKSLLRVETEEVQWISYTALH